MPPTTTERPLTYNATGDIHPSLVSGNVLNLPAGTTLGGAPIDTGSIATWGSIAGTLSAQTDLQNALNAKQATAGTLALAGFSSITGRVGNSNLPLGAQLKNTAGTFTTLDANAQAGYSNGTEIFSWSDAGLNIAGGVSATGTGANSAVITISGAGGNVVFDIARNDDGAHMLFFDGNDGSFRVGPHPTVTPTFSIGGIYLNPEDPGQYDQGTFTPANLTGDRTYHIPDASGTLALTTNTSGIVQGDDTAYDATSWNANTGVPTKNALRDKFETLGSGTVTSFSAGDLSPLFTTSEATATTTPALTFALTDAAAHTLFGNFTGSSGAPSYNVLGTGVDTFLATPTLANLNSAISDDDVAGLAAANTFSGANIFSKAGAASTPAVHFTGTWFTGGTGTTTFPHLLLQATGTTASTTWSTAGTAIGLNAVTGFTGNFVDFKLAGSSTSALTVAYNGLLTAQGNITTGASTALQSNGNLKLLGRGFIIPTNDGIWTFTDNATTGWTRANFGTATNSSPAIGRDLVNGFTIQSAAGTATWNDASTAASGTVANRAILQIAAPTLTATNTGVIYTVASTLRLGGAPTGSANVTIGSPYTLELDAGNTLLGAACNFVLDATTGTKWGTATTQKQAWWNATPVVQPTAVADASGGVVLDIEARARLNELLARLRTVGMIAT